jgi:hypothetical protein
MLIGAFGPWGKVIGLINTSISGTDGSNDGWFVVGAAVVGALALFGWWQGRGRWLALGPLLAGAAGLLVTYSDRGNVTDIESSSTTNLAHFQVGWGLNLAMGASAGLGVVGLVALLGRSDAPGMLVAVEESKAPDPTAEVTRQEQPVPPSSQADELERLAGLRSRGVLTDEEFRVAKERLLGTTATSTEPADAGEQST